jgi:hypothetical protein
VPVPVENAAEESEPLDPFGDLVPFADPSWYQGVRPSFPSLFPPYSKSKANADDGGIVPQSLLQRNARRPPRRNPRLGILRNRTQRRRMG